MTLRLFTAPSSSDHRLFSTGFERAIAFGVLGLVLALAVVQPAAAQEKHWWRTEMRLSLVNANPWVTAIQPHTGWQLTVDMKAKNHKLLGIGVASYPPFYPYTDITGYLVFKDPDSCPSLISFAGQANAYFGYHCTGTPDPELPDCIPPDWGPILAAEAGSECPSFIPIDLEEALQWEKDETWVEFTPGLSTKQAIGVEEEEPVLWIWNGDWQLSSYGPDLGTVDDDLRYGSWPRMPGLVVIADHGPGVRFNEPVEGETEPASDFFDLIEPREAWNLAGFFQSAAFSLMGGNGETSLMAHMNVPSGLFTPVVLFDNNISLATTDDQGVLCGTDDALYRMDGGPLTCLIGGGSANASSIVNDAVVTLRVFMLDGVAPDIIEDMDGNGRIDIHDAERMGFDPVSSQKTTRFKQYHEYFCGHPYDFDGDGFGGTCVLGARPGGIRRPPR